MDQTFLQQDAESESACMVVRAGVAVHKTTVTLKGGIGATSKQIGEPNNITH